MGGGGGGCWHGVRILLIFLICYFLGVYFLLSIIKEANQVFKKGNHFGVCIICDLSALVWVWGGFDFLFVGLGNIFFALKFLFQSCVFTCP